MYKSFLLVVNNQPHKMATIHMHVYFVLPVCKDCYHFTGPHWSTSKESVPYLPLYVHTAANSWKPPDFASLRETTHALFLRLNIKEILLPNAKCNNNSAADRMKFCVYSVIIFLKKQVALHSQCNHVGKVWVGGLKMLGAHILI